jgi:hypothetical protein
MRFNGLVIAQIKFLCQSTLENLKFQIPGLSESRKKEHIVACTLKARIVKPAETAVAREQLCKHAWGVGDGGLRVGLLAVSTAVSTSQWWTAARRQTVVRGCGHEECCEIVAGQ